MADEFCSPLIATGSGSDLGIAEEVCYGDDIVNPSLTVFPRVSTSLALTKDSYQSAEVRSDRQVIDARHGIRQAGGDVVTEIAPGRHEMAYEALLGGVWETPADMDVSSNNVTFAISAGVVTATLAAGDWVTSDFYLGDTIQFEDSGESAFDDVNITIIALDEGVATVALPASFVTSGFPTTLSAGTCVLKGARVRMANIYRSFVFERAFTDIGSFLVFNGQRFNTAAIELPPTGIATATFGLLGKNAKPLATASIDGVAEITLGPSDLTSLTFNGPNRTITAASGSFAAAGINPGDRILVSGTGITDEQNRNPRTVVAVSTNVLTVAEALQTGGPYTTPFEVTRVGLPAYTAAVDTEILTAVSGQLYISGVPVGTVTAASINLDNGMGGSDVVGANVRPNVLWGNQSAISGSLTVLFDRAGIGETIYNAFDEETEMTAIMRLDTADRADFMSFIMPRIKVNTGTIGDAVAEGLPVTAEFMALKPTDPNAIASQILFQDSTIAGIAPLAPPNVVPQTLTAEFSHEPGETTLTLENTANADGYIVYTASIDGFTYTYAYNFSDGDSASAVATAFAAVIDGDPAAYMAASAVSGVITVTMPDGPVTGEAVTVQTASASTSTPTPAAITAGATGAGASATSVTITIGGGPNDSITDIDTSLAIDGGSAIPSNVTVEAGDGPTSIATALAAEIITDGGGDLDAVAIAGVITVTLLSGTGITTATAVAS